MQDNPFAKYANGPIMSPVNPADAAKEARDNERLAIAQEELRIKREEAAAKAAKEASERAEKDKKFEGSRTSASVGLSRVIDQIDRIETDAKDNNGWFETGATGEFSRNNLPAGTAAFDLAANVGTIDANSAFAALQEMRNNSPTGGALGNVTEMELKLLKSQIANLDPNQSQEQFLQNLATARQAYLDMLRRVDPDAVAAYEASKQAGQGAGLTGVVTDDRPQDGLSVRVTDDSPPSSPPGGGNGMGDIVQGLYIGTGDLIQSAGDLAGIVANPVGTAIYSAMGSDKQADLGSYLRDDLLGIPHGDPMAEAINRGGMAAMTGGLAARGASALMQPGTVRNALSVLGSNPGLDMAAGAGAGAGGQLGKMSGVPGGEIAGTLAGGLGGFGAASRIARGPAVPNALAQAATRQGVDLLPADAGGVVPKMITSATRASPISAGPVVKASQRAQDQAKKAVGRVAEEAGDILETDEAGAAIRAGAERFSRQTSARGSQMYDRAHKAAKGVTIKPRTAVAVLDENIARLSEMGGTNAPMLKALTTLKGDIANGVSVRGLRDARTSLSQGVYDGKLRSTQEKKIYQDVLNALSQDIEAGLRSVGRDGAADAFKRADKFWRERVEHIDEVLEPILGKNRGGEEIVAAVESMARGKQGGNMRLSRLLGNMTPQEAGNVRATIIDRIGKANPGAQDAEGTAFSPATFLTNWNKMTPQAKASLFGDGKMRSDLNDLAKIAEGMKTSQAMANHSNTAPALLGNAVIGGAAAVASWPVLLKGAGAAYVTGRLMASPGFARLLARTAKMPPEAARRTMSEQLGILAGRESLIAGDAKALQDYLRQSVAQSPTRAAASEEEQN